MKRIAVFLLLFLLLTGCHRAVLNNTVSPSAAASVASSAMPTPVPAKKPAQTPRPTPTPRPIFTPIPVESKVPIEGINRQELTTPVLIKGFLAGGLYRGEWMMYDAFFNTGAMDFDGFLYDVYVDDAQTGKAFGGLPLDCKSGEPLLQSEYEYGYDAVDLYDVNHEQVEYDIALDADWDIFPRGYASQSTDQPQYQALAENFIAQEGIEDPVTALQQVMTVDLEGDGADEVLFVAANTTDHLPVDTFVDYQFEPVKKGDNAVLVFRKIVDGQPVDQFIDWFIVMEDPEYESIYRYLFYVETCADLDADGVLEVIVKSWYYEGTFWAVYKLVGNELVMVACNGFGV